MYPCTKFEKIWRTSVFDTKFAPKNTIQGDVLGQIQPENDLFEVKDTIGWFQVVSGWFQVVSDGFR